MTHEPECEFEGERDLAFICKTCDDLQSAYKRGRSDAAKTIEDWYKVEKWQLQDIHYAVEDCIELAKGKML